jgi:hypothetical protein
MDTRAISTYVHLRTTMCRSCDIRTYSVSITAGCVRVYAYEFHVRRGHDTSQQPPIYWKNNQFIRIGKFRLAQTNLAASIMYASRGAHALRWPTPTESMLDRVASLPFRYVLLLPVLTLRTYGPQLASPFHLYILSTRGMHA